MTTAVLERGPSVVEERGAAVALSPRSPAATRPTIAVVCTYWGDYERYLKRWEAGIASQTVQPDQVIVHNDTWDHHSMGRARNRAIGMTNTDWVVHVDVDDVLLPNAIEDTIPHLQTSDVVVWNYRAVGGPNDGIDRQLVNSGSWGTVVNTAIAMSNAPFRRSLWERSPYLEIAQTQPGLDSACDTFLWVGFLRLNAVFRNIPGIQFEYHRTENSMSQVALAYNNEDFMALLIRKNLKPRLGEGQELVRVPMYVAREAKRIALELGVAQGDVIEYAWRLAQAEKSSVWPPKPQVSGADQT